MTNSGYVPAAARVCNLVPSRDTARDWTFGDAVAVGTLGAVAALPPSVDLRRDWWTVSNQEDTGSCVGWATGDGLMRYHLVTANRMDKADRVSPRFIWMSSKETDEFVQRPETFIEGGGTSLKAAVDVCRNYGVVREEVLPFHIATKMYTGPETVFWAQAAQNRVASYFNLRLNLDNWKSWLANHGPILIGLGVDATWDNATATGGVLSTFQPNTVRGGHAVAAVGYQANGRIILRNSWGTAWGDDGFAYATPEYIAGACFDEAYGITL
ncbi:C1 family peptidase [Nocardia sp. NPDC127579]|uniref:C1 family peptidase n=1 Tax=Nocardia sp. NPDC127579 TaxID=3345402 RepID=UPI003642C1B1